MGTRVFTPEHREKLRQAKLKNPTRFWAGKKRPDMQGENHHFFGVERSIEDKEKISQSLTGKYKGSQIANWKSENVSYRNLHRWVERHLGKPDTCEHCETSGLKERKIHWANKDGQYRRELSDWVRLCSSCHGQYDKQNGLRKHNK